MDELDQLKFRLREVLSENARLSMLCGNLRARETDVRRLKTYLEQAEVEKQSLQGDLAEMREMVRRESDAARKYRDRVTWLTEHWEKAEARAKELEEHMLEMGERDG